MMSELKKRKKESTSHHTFSAKKIKTPKKLKHFLCEGFQLFANFRFPGVREGGGSKLKSRKRRGTSA
jgi:hypothetical protein